MEYIDFFQAFAPDSNVESIASDDVNVDSTCLECPRCKQREEVFTRNVGVGICSISDKVGDVEDRSTESFLNELSRSGLH